MFVNILGNIANFYWDTSKIDRDTAVQTSKCHGIGKIWTGISRHVPTCHMWSMITQDTDQLEPRCK